MNEPPEETKKRLLFILHRGLIEARLLAQAGKVQQLYDLADCMETVPAYMARWQDKDLEAIRKNLKIYKEKYPDNRFNHLDFLDQYSPPEF